MGKAIGIDLGTTNSVVAFKDVSVRTFYCRQFGIQCLEESYTKHCSICKTSNGRIH